MVRILLIALIAALLLSIAGAALAYRLILIPVGEVLPDNVYKLEYSGPFIDGPDNWYTGYRFDYSLGKGFEIATKSGCQPGDSIMPGRQTTGMLVNLNWQIAKETKSTPGYGLGVWNVYDSDDHVAVKESFFAGIYKSFDVGMKYPIKVHVVGGTKQLDGIFGGLLIPLSKRCQMAAEWVPEPSEGKGLRTQADKGLAVAIGYNQTKNWRFKYANVGGDNAWGIVYTHKCSFCDNLF